MSNSFFLTPRKTYFDAWWLALDRPMSQSQRHSNTLLPDPQPNKCQERRSSVNAPLLASSGLWPLATCFWPLTKMLT